ncbi:hypothetical protein CVT25_005446 [Psilocybe cyanescens]|uniref:DUF6534 domain-containing protein n=1 Tax=Psilocybe cyanescens TaxID=93625 RepID=A0A409X5W4_PSICY|nr:hypothetical protein CVT25_005446 [Psilocybe cyanescens]
MSNTDAILGIGMYRRLIPFETTNNRNIPKGQYCCVFLIKLIGQLWTQLWDSRFYSCPTRPQVIATGDQAYFHRLRASKQALFLKTTTSIQNISSLGCDVLISATLCFIFHAHRSGMKKSDSLINKLIIYTINRAIATSLCSLLTVVLFQSLYGTFYFKIPFLASAQVYVISVISLLTSRRNLQEENNRSINLTNLVQEDLTSAERYDHVKISHHDSS